MKIEPFELERWLLSSREIDVAGAGVTKLRLNEVTTNIDYSRLMKYDVTTNGSEILRKTIAEWFPDISADNVLVTSATSEANLLCNLHLLEAQDEYVVEYPCYKQTVGLAKGLSCKIKEVFLDEINGWKPDLCRLNEMVTRKTKVIFFDNPNNPTGSLLAENEMRAICEIAQDVGAYVVCDNALRGSELDGKPAVTPFQYYERGVITGSLSKLGITDPRIGWLIGNRELVSACWRIKDYTTLSHSSLGEQLATEALQNRQRIIKRNLEFSKSCLAILSKWMNENNNLFSWVPPKSGFTVFPKYNSSLGSEEFCRKFLRQEKVLICPGVYFGLDKHLRINVGSSNETTTEALKRLGRFARGLL